MTFNGISFFCELSNKVFWSCCHGYTSSIAFFMISRMEKTEKTEKIMKSSLENILDYSIGLLGVIGIHVMI